jgi:hypothetical protein
MDVRQLGERLDVLDVVSDDSTAVLDPRVRAEASTAHAHTDSNAAPVHTVSLEHPVDRDGADETEGPKYAVITGAAHRQSKLLSPVH